MNTSNNNIQDFILAKLHSFKNWLFKHAKIIMPVVLLVCVAVTVVIAVNANKNKAGQEETVIAEPEVEVVGNLMAVPEISLEKDAIPEINELFKAFFDAQLAGDTDTIKKLGDQLTDMESIRVQVHSRFIEDYPTVEVYSKVGPKEGTYIVYVYNECKYYDYDKPLPGIEAHYVCRDESGNYYINDSGEGTESEKHYVEQVTLQDDVVDLYNKVTVAYNDMVDQDDELKKFLADLEVEIDKNVGEALAKAEGSEQTEEEQGGEEVPEQTEEPATPELAQVVTKVKATSVVNIRKSDSETADKLGKAAIGDEFKLLEERGNGWSKVEYEGGEAFIKSDYLEPSETMVASADSDGNSSDNSEAEETTTSETPAESTGTVTVIENVRIRKSASETSEKIGTAYMGEKLELVMKQADGWTKIRYNGEIAYVKSDYVE